MKSINGYILAGLLLISAAAVQAQISNVSVSSYSGNGDDLQIVGSISSQNTLANITSGSSSLWTSGWSNYFGSYYTSNGAATVLAPSSGSFLSTSVVNQYAPSQGFTSANPFFNVSGRFYIESGTTTWDDNGSHVEGGFGGSVQFTVGTTSSVDLQLVGNGLSAYGLSGASAPYAYVWGPNGYVGSLSGEGTTSLGTLAPGNYTVYVSASDDTTSGLVVVSLWAN